eukprot:12890460-Prorocentrum_lima.AAC.1
MGKPLFYTPINLRQIARQCCGPPAEDSSAQLTQSPSCDASLQGNVPGVGCGWHAVPDVGWDVASRQVTSGVGCGGM